MKQLALCLLFLFHFSHLKSQSNLFKSKTEAFGYFKGKWYYLATGTDTVDMNFRREPISKYYLNFIDTSSFGYLGANGKRMHELIPYIEKWYIKSPNIIGLERGGKTTWFTIETINPFELKLKALKE
jgi:hypothetical protein